MTAVLILVGDSAASIPESDKRRRVNGLRETFGLIGAPIRLSMRLGSENRAIRAFSRRPLPKAPPGGTGLQPDRDPALVYSVVNGLRQEATP